MGKSDHRPHAAPFDPGADTTELERHMSEGKSLYLLGGGGHAKVIADIARSRGWVIGGIIDISTPVDMALLGSRVVDISEVVRRSSKSSPATAFVAIGNNAARRREYLSIISLGFEVPPLVHRSAIVAMNVEVDPGASIMAGVVIQPDVKIGEAAVINTHASIDHDCEIGEGAFIGPGATLCGGVSVGEGAFVGAGVTITPGIRIGTEAFVGAGTVVVNDIGPGQRLKQWRHGTHSMDSETNRIELCNDRY